MDCEVIREYFSRFSGFEALPSGGCGLWRGNSREQAYDYVNSLRGPTFGGLSVITV